MKWSVRQTKSPCWCSKDLHHCTAPSGSTASHGFPVRLLQWFFHPEGSASSSSHLNSFCLYSYCLYSYCLYSYCLYSYCLYSYCIYSYGLYSSGLYSYASYDCGLYRYGLYSNGQYSYGKYSYGPCSDSSHRRYVSAAVLLALNQAKLWPTQLWPM